MQCINPTVVSNAEEEAGRILKDLLVARDSFDGALSMFYQDSLAHCSVSSVVCLTKYVSMESEPASISSGQKAKPPLYKSHQVVMKILSRVCRFVRFTHISRSPPFSV
jgi:hypothetical protein